MVNIAHHVLIVVSLARRESCQKNIESSASFEGMWLKCFRFYDILFKIPLLHHFRFQISYTGMIWSLILQREVHRALYRAIQLCQTNILVIICNFNRKHYIITIRNMLLALIEFIWFLVFSGEREKIGGGCKIPNEILQSRIFVMSRCKIRISDKTHSKT